jgi:uncharacterized membrane protein
MEALGPAVIVLSLPLLFRWVPPNRLYGFRVPATLRDRSVWYDVNAACARHFVLLGGLMVLLEFVLPPPALVPTLRLIAVAGLTLILIVNWRAANRLERERAR